MTKEKARLTFLILFFLIAMYYKKEHMMFTLSRPDQELVVKN